jgi:exosortase B
VPTFYGLGSWLWQQDEYAHGPIVLAIIAWLFWRERAAILSPDSHRSTAAGFALLLFSLAAYILGRSHQIALFEVGSLAPLLAGVLLAMRGWPALRALWFPICFVVFLIPLPGFFVDALTGPLKQAVSRLVVEILHPVGYPIARDGVMLTVGQYQLLVADACSGMNSMFSLSALGLLFMHLSGRRSLLHSAVMLASILPIAFVANIVRVLALILITFHFGDAAGQGFLHGAAGMVLVLAALAFLLALDSILTRIHKPQISN